jgi:hypothetical protein
VSIKKSPLIIPITIAKASEDAFNIDSFRCCCGPSRVNCFPPDILLAAKAERVQGWSKNSPSGSCSRSAESRTISVLRVLQ